MFSRFSIDETALITEPSGYRYGRVSPSMQHHLPRGGRVGAGEEKYAEEEEDSQGPIGFSEHSSLSGGITRHRKLSSITPTSGTSNQSSFSRRSSSASRGLHHRTSASDGIGYADLNHKKHSIGEEEEKTVEFEPLTSYSIAAQKQAALQQPVPRKQSVSSPSTALTNFTPSSAAMPPGLTRQSSDDSADMDREMTLHNNTTTNKYTGNNPAIPVAGNRNSLTAILRRTSYPYAVQAQNVVNHTNMNFVLQQIGVNTAEAATVMVNLIKAKEGRRGSLAMVI
jgi:hypothetical protein